MGEIYEKKMKRINHLFEEYNKKSLNSENKNDTNSKQKQNKQLYQFFEDLLYGKIDYVEHYIPDFQRKTKCTIYLNQNHFQILTCIDIECNKIRKYFNVKNLQIISICPQYQTGPYLKPHNYLILKEKHEEFILIFNEDESNDSNQSPNKKKSPSKNGHSQKNKSISKRAKFYQNITNFIKFMKKMENMYDPMILKSFVKTDTNQNDEINQNQLVSLVQQMKIHNDQSLQIFIKNILKKKELKKIYYSDFQKLWKILYCREELKGLFQKYISEELMNYEDYLKPLMSESQFSQFLIHEQCDAPKMVQQLSLEMFSEREGHISFYNFCIFVMRHDNNIIDPNFIKNFEGLTQENTLNLPLNKFFVYSSHNTFLTGNQLLSNCEIQRYLIDLQNGIRYVEVDINDGSQINEGKQQAIPIVKQGYPLTKKITFEKVIETIHRFTQLSEKKVDVLPYSSNNIESKTSNSLTPIILSLNILCNKQNQEKAAEILNKYFQKIILKINSNTNSFPTMKQCLGKIIISSSGSSQHFQQFLENKSQSKFFNQSQALKESKIKEKLQKKEQSQSHKKIREQFCKQIKQLQQSKIQFKNSSNIFKRWKQNYNQSILLSDSSKKVQSKIQISKGLLDMIAILSISSQNSGDKPSFCESLSIGQKKVQQSYNRRNEDIANLANQIWIRSYPRGLRLDSSNFNPLISLEMRIQIIALNTQKLDDPYNHLMRMFFLRGSSNFIGYRPIPDYKAKKSQQKPRKNELASLLQNSQESTGRQQETGVKQSESPPMQKQTIPKQSKLTQSIYLDKQYYENQKQTEHLFTQFQIVFVSAERIYQNDQTNQKIPSVRVEAYFLGTKRDSSHNPDLLEKKPFTNQIEQNAFNPKFNSETIFIKSYDIELGFLVVEIKQCGRAVIPLESMRSGYRTIFLWDEKLKQKESRILCKVKVTPSDYLTIYKRRKPQMKVAQRNEEDLSRSQFIKENNFHSLTTMKKNTSASDGFMDIRSTNPRSMSDQKNLEH